MTANGVEPCWICGGNVLSLLRRSNMRAPPSGADFRITDANYGTTADLYACDACGFVQCRNIDDVLRHYREMDDASYEDTRPARRMQADRLLAALARWKPAGRLLDVGAGSGILVEAARARGYDAEGVEPSAPLTRQARGHGLPVHEGVLPHPAVRGPFDVVTLIDVIEHVPQPVGLLREIRGVTADDGVLAVITPDVTSVAARLMGRRWWHYRVAHIGYFSPRTLAHALDDAGFAVLKTHRPGWWFPMDYLARRLVSYLPARLRPPVPRCLHRVTLPLNLFDSLLMICRKRETERPVP